MTLFGPLFFVALIAMMVFGFFSSDENAQSQARTIARDMSIALLAFLAIMAIFFWLILSGI